MESIDQKELVAATLLQNLFKFNKLVLQGDNPHDLISEKPHLKLCQIVQDWHTGSPGGSGKRKKLILMPRGHFKSSVVTEGLSALEICKSPDIRIMVGSEVNALAKTFLGNVKTHFESNERLRYLYGDHVRIKSKWTEDSITSKLRTRPRKEPTLFTTGTDQARTGWHCDLAILDDPVSALTIGTADARKKTLDWYREIVNNILDPDGRLIVIGTRWHDDDLYNYIMENEADEYDIIREQIMTDEAYSVLKSDRPLSVKEQLITEDMILFPVRFTVPKIYSLYKSSGIAKFNNQQMNRVMDDEEVAFREQDIQWYDPRNVYDQRRLMDLNCYILIDPGIGEKVENDDTAIVCVGVDKSNHWWVLEYDNGQFRPDDIVKRTFAMYQRHYPFVRKIGEESVQAQKWLKYNFETEEKKTRTRLPLEMLERDTKVIKEMRIKGVLDAVIGQKRLHLQRGMEDLINQIKRFPKTPKDDIIDALADTAQVTQPFRGLTMRDKVKERGRERAKPNRWGGRSASVKY